MFFYFALAILYCAFAILSSGYARNSRWLDVIVLVIFIAVAGARFETGYDWVVYDYYFNSIKDPTQCYTGPYMEPGFWLLNRIVNFFSSSLSTIFFVIAIFNAVALYFFTRAFRGDFPLVAAIYFCWLYLPVQMGVIRQSIAVSCFMLALIAWSQRKKLTAITASFATLMFQFSAVLYLPLLFQRVSRFFIKHLVYSLVVMIACALCSFFLLDHKGPGIALFTFIAELPLGGISDKFHLYSLIDAHVSMGGIGYFVFNVLFIFFFRYRFELNKTDYLLLSSVMMLIIIETLFYDVAILWTRMMYLTIPCQAVLVSRKINENPSQRKYLLYASLLISLAMFAYGFRNLSYMRPYYPYQSVLTEVKGNDGRKRAMDFYIETNKRPEFSKVKSIIDNHKRMLENQSSENISSDTNLCAKLSFADVADQIKKWFDKHSSQSDSNKKTP